MSAALGPDSGMRHCRLVIDPYATYQANRCFVSGAAPNLNLTPEEKKVYGQLFRQADTESVGVVTGEIAVKFFEKTRLDSRILGEVRPLPTVFALPPELSH